MSFKPINGGAYADYDDRALSRDPQRVAVSDLPIVDLSPSRAMIVSSCSMRWRMDLRHVFAANLRRWVRCAWPQNPIGMRRLDTREICPLRKAKAGTSAQLAHLPVRAV
jgi:hypothetical protein